MTITDHQAGTAGQPSAPAGLPPVAAPRDRDTRWELAAALRTFGRLGYEFGFKTVLKIRSVVVLPAPLGPRRPKIAPG